MGLILHGGTHPHPFIAAVGLKATPRDRRGRSSRYVLTTFNPQEPLVQDAPISIRRDVSSLEHPIVSSRRALQGQSVDRGLVLPSRGLRPEAD